MDTPVIALTMGDPAGIGPELITKVLAPGSVHASCRPLVVGDPTVLRTICHVAGAELRFRPVADVSEAAFSWPEIDVLTPEGVRVERVVWGQVDAEMGKVAALCLQMAAELALSGAIDGIVSAPLNKESFHLAGCPYRDELAFLADLTGSTEPFHLGVVASTWTATVTEHIPFRDIVGAITQGRVLACIAMLDGALRRAGFAHPRIAVAALNVHGGEGGLFGREEIDEIGPAIGTARGRSIDAEGPIPADSVFVRAFSGEFDGVVCMYHDQANIARKLQPWEQGATLFLGLPVVCSTTAHGTAFDKAGQGVADARGLQTALGWVVRFASSGRPT